jgi:L-malate glycosyltransferase
MFKVLIVVNIVLPRASYLIEQEKTVYGGWLSSLVDNISKKNDIKISVASTYIGTKIKKKMINGVTYYLLPKRGLFDVYKKHCQYIFEDFKPDLLHIEGSEFKHANTFIKSWNGINILSAQGILNGYFPYYDGGLPLTKMLFSFKFPNFFCSLSVFLKKMMIRTRLNWEIETIKSAKNLSGRTNWDLAYFRKFNPDADYYRCNRILREPFYKHKWSIDEIERHSIYVGNSYQPLKGFHFIINAVSVLKGRFPDIKVYVAGTSPYDKRLKRNIVRNGYAFYLRSLIYKLDLKDNIVFLGNIDAEDVILKLKRVNLFCLPSTIENSPNTLSEAMILGVPSVASFVGGVGDMAINNEEVLFYRYDEIDFLVHQISRIFKDDRLAIKLSSNSRKKALKMHSINDNIEKIYKCYKSILKN